MIYLLSEKRLKTDLLNENVDSSLVLSAIQTAQDIYLRQTLGDKLYNTICEQVQNNNLNEPYKTLLDEYIIIYLEYLAMAELCVPSSFKLGNIGVAQAYDANVNTQTIQNVKYLESYYKQKASTYENRLVTYIKKNINLYPEYINTTEVVTAKESTLQTGLYLGGTSRTTTKGTSTTSSNTNNDKQYVSYIKPQRLTDAEKAQARENIGVDIDSSNFYTKNDINVIVNGIEQSIPSKTSDLTLDNVYTKQQVNKIVDDIPLPQYTSELILDNVYSKQQVDTLINQIPTFSGDYEDLTNKPSIYTQEEINTLISNINTFSGDYNDLTNKPTLFSGSYNDLSDKPTIPTATSQLQLDNVYNKSEIDLQFAEINTTLGSINNILNTI